MKKQIYLWMMDRIRLVLSTSQSLSKFTFLFDLHDLFHVLLANPTHKILQLQLFLGSLIKRIQSKKKQLSLNQNTMLKLTKQSQSTLRLPNINSKFFLSPQIDIHSKTNSQVSDYHQDESAQVSKLEEWSSNKPNKKPRNGPATHNLSFIYKNSAIRQQRPPDYGKNFQFIDIQMFIAKIDNELQKIAETNYFSIYKNMQYCSGVYENSFNSLLKKIAKNKVSLQAELDQIQLKLRIQRQQHIKKVHELQESHNQSYKDKINEVRELLEQKEMQIKPLRKLLSKIQSTKTKVLKFCLALGYDVREQGLLWIIKQLGVIPKPEQFPSFLSNKEINFILTKYTNEYEASNIQHLMKTQICGKSINEAYEHVNRRKRRQLSFIKENQQLAKIYTNRIKDYSRQKHTYLSDSTLQIAKQIEKDKPKPTRYEIIYKQTSKKLNKICREKIHPQLFPKTNKENNKPSNQSSREKQSVRRKQKKRSTIIIQEFSKMLNLSINQSKKLDELYTRQQKEFEQILREIRNEKYSQSVSHRASINKFDCTQQDNKLRNPISILSCLVGWKKAQKIIEQEMFGY